MKLYNKFKEELVGEQIEVKQRIMNLILAVGVACSIVAIAFNIIADGGIVSIFASVISLILSVCGLVISVKFNKPKVCGVAVISVINLVIFPITFFYCGGINSGMALWFLFGLILVWLFLDGIAFVITLALSIIAVVTTYILELNNPEMQKVELTQIGFTVDVLSIMIIVMFVVGIIVKYQVDLYEKQHKMVEAQEEKLLDAINEANMANTAKSMFLANMSHELRTPINAIMGMNEMIMRETDSDDISIYADNIKKASQSLVSMVNDILDLSNLESGNMEIVPDKYDVKELIEDCYDNVYTRASIKNLSYEFDNNENIPKTLVGDKYRIRQVILNLLTNAVKFTSVGGVKVYFDCETISERETKFIVTVKDTGNGISQAYIDRMESPYGDSDTERNRNVSGNGLGLSITKRLVDLMGGNIEVISENGVGTTFTVSIPQYIGDAAPTGKFVKVMNVKNSREFKPTFKAPKAKLLLVDDIAINLTVIQGLLRRTQIQVDAVLSGALALERAKDKDYDIIILDHMMPEMDGIETLHKIKKLDNANSTAPVIVLTANAIMGARDLYLEEGFDDYLSKPAKADVLEQMIFKYLPDDLIEE